ncbi:MAG: hypothetical protein ACPK85_03290 [Methanosarcina sp.]
MTIGVQEKEKILSKYCDCLWRRDQISPVTGKACVFSIIRIAGD